MKANDRQVSGNHYRKNGSEIQHWDFAASQNFDYFQGQVTKYVTRWKDKNGIADLEKAKHFLEKYIEVETAKQAHCAAVKLPTPLEPNRLAGIKKPLSRSSVFGFDPKEELGDSFEHAE
jgi:hypothetical protein